MRERYEFHTVGRLTLFIWVQLFGGKIVSNIRLFFRDKALHWICTRGLGICSMRRMVARGSVRCKLRL